MLVAYFFPYLLPSECTSLFYLVNLKKDWSSLDVSFICCRSSPLSDFYCMLPLPGLWAGYRALAGLSTTPRVIVPSDATPKPGELREKQKARIAPCGGDFACLYTVAIYEESGTLFIIIIATVLRAN